MAFLHPEEDRLFEPSMALPVTRHALIPFQESWSFLLCGIDSLDLGGFVNWGANWKILQGSLQNDKERAAKTQGGLPITLPDGRHILFLPNGKPPQYRYHLQFAEYHLYIGISELDSKTPNVYISINAETIWRLGLTNCLDLVRHDLESFGGELLHFQVSRVDLAADFHIPGDVSLSFLDQHKVSRSRDQQNYLSNGHLETYYIGAPGAPIRLRIYDKGTEIAKTNKQWFLKLWRVDRPECVWRVEFQLRRKVIKELGIGTTNCLRSKLGGAWGYLTEEWFSLRLPDQARQDRRTVHPWWEDIQGVADQFGPVIDLQRLADADQPASLDWYISHLSGCLPSIAARLGTNDYREAAIRLHNEMCNYWFNRNFQEEYAKRAIKLGKHPATGGEHEKEW
jgi:hypothetical protein